MPDEQQNEQQPAEQLTKKQRRELKKQQKEQARQEAAKKQQRKSTLMWVLVVVGLGLIIWGIVALSNQEPVAPLGGVGDIAASDHVKGNSTDPVVTLIEYSDFQCPACKSYYPMVKQLADEYGDKLAVVYRHYPLTSIHPNAELAAQASEAAALQGKFWDMHDKLFEEQNAWSRLSRGDARDQFIFYAESLGLDTAQFEQDMESDAVEQKVKADEQTALQSGLRGTPTFFLDGEQLPNPGSYDDFAFTIQNLIENKENNVQ